MAPINLKAIFYDWFGWNTRLFEVLNTGLPEAGQPLAHIGSALGNYWAAPFMLTALVLWARHTRRAGYATSATKISIQAYRFGWACLLALLVTGFLKWGLDFARPGTVLGHGVRILAPVERSHGFPSGHSVYAALVLCALWPLVLWPSRILLLLLLLWVGYARVAMGAHFPADVVAGWLVGTSCLLAAGAVLARVRRWAPDVALPATTHPASKKPETTLVIMKFSRASILQRLATAWPWWALAAVVTITDVATKDWVRWGLFKGESIPVTGFFNLVYFQNAGAAFSFLADAGGWQRYFFIVIALVVALVLTWALSFTRPRLEAIAFSLILGGAMGNVVDRIVHGHVTDFLDFHWHNWHWPAFNVADIAICLGAFVLACWAAFDAVSKTRLNSGTSHEN